MGATLNKLIEAWELSPSLHNMQPGASDDELDRAERTLGQRLSEALRQLYRYSNGLRLCRGSLTFYPLSGDSLTLTSATTQLREWRWPIPEEVLVVGANGGGEPYGVWLPPSRFPLPVVQVGAIFKPDCLALVATGLVPFLLVQTAGYLLCAGDQPGALEVLGVPRRIQSAQVGTDTMTELRRWADPKLPNPAADVYEDRLTVDDITWMVR
jgi:SMI1/KNR4 family protein SUKH-1